MKQKTSLQQQLYTVAFVDLSIKNILDSSSLFHRPEWMDTMFLLIFFGCIGWKLMLQRYTKPMLFGTALFGLIFALVSFKMSYFFLLFTFCGVAAAQDINLKQVLRYTSVTKILMLLSRDFTFMQIDTHLNHGNIITARSLSKSAFPRILLIEVIII